MNKKIGKLAFWTTRRGFGVIETRNDFVVTRYFVHRSKIILMEPEEPYPGCIVHFDSVPDGRPEKYDLAIDAEIYKPADTEAGKAALASGPVTDGIGGAK